MEIKEKNPTKEFYQTIFKVVEKYESLTACKVDRLTLSMDLENTLTIEEVNRLNNECNDADFLHDVTGIRNNINRETGKLENCFTPRCTS